MEASLDRQESRYGVLANNSLRPLNAKEDNEHQKMVFL
jgi:hypothetical protein